MHQNIYILYIYFIFMYKKPVKKSNAKYKVSLS